MSCIGRWILYLLSHPGSALRRCSAWLKKQPGGRGTGLAQGHVGSLFMCQQEAPPTPSLGGPLVILPASRVEPRVRLTPPPLTTSRLLVDKERQSPPESGVESWRAPGGGRQDPRAVLSLAQSVPGQRFTAGSPRSTWTLKFSLIHPPSSFPALPGPILSSVSMTDRNSKGSKSFSLRAEFELLLGTWGLPRWLRGKESACQCRDMGSMPESRRSPGEGHGNPLQYSCLKSPTDRGAWGAMIMGPQKSDTTE